MENRKRITAHAYIAARREGKPLPPGATLPSKAAGRTRRIAEKILSRTLAAVVMVPACAALGQGVHYTLTVTDPRLRTYQVQPVIPNATVTVCKLQSNRDTFPCDIKQLIYSDAAMTQSLPNPVTADAAGTVSFYADPGGVAYTATDSSGANAGRSAVYAPASGTVTGTPGTDYLAPSAIGTTVAAFNDSRIVDALQTGVANTAANGTTDDSAALNVPLASGKDAYLSPGANYLIGSNSTWTGVVHPLSGAKILVGNGVTLTINAKPDAPLVRIFTVVGTGQVVFGPGVSQVPVEWFGAVADWNGTTGTDNTAAIQACLNAITAGQCVLQASTYKTTAALSITKGNTGLVGTLAGYTYPNPNAASILMQTTAGADTLDVAGNCSGTYATWNRFENFALQRSVVPTGTAKGFSASCVGGMIMNYVYSEDSVTDFYFHSVPNYGTGSINNTAAGWGFASAVNYPTGDYIGYWLDSGDGVPENTIVINNAGTGVNGGSFGSAGTTHGTVISGAAMNDVNITLMSAAGTSYGMEINYIPASTSNAAPAADIHCNFCTFDDESITGIKISNVPAVAARGLINFDGGWVALLRTGVQNAIEVDNSSAAITFANMQIINGHGIGAYLYHSSHVKFTGNSLMATGAAGVATQQVTDSIFSNNLLVGDQTFPTATFFSIANGSTNNIFTANSVSGYGANGFNFDATSTGNKFCNNVVDAANLTGAAFGGAGYADTCSGSGASSTATAAVFSDPFSGTGPLNPGWSQTTSTADPVIGPITSSAGTATSGATHHGVALYTGGAYTYDQFSEATVPTLGGYDGLIVRSVVAGTSGYLWSPGDRVIYVLNTANLHVGGGGVNCPTVSAGDKLRLSVVGTSFTCLNVTTGASYTGTDTTYTSGYVGIATGSNVPVGPWRGGSGSGN